MENSEIQKVTPNCMGKNMLLGWNRFNRRILDGEEIQFSPQDSVSTFFYKLIDDGIVLIRKIKGKNEFIFELNL